MTTDSVRRRSRVDVLRTPATTARGRRLLAFSARALPWRLAPLLPMYVAAALLIQHGSRLVDDEGSLLVFAHALLHGHYATLGSLNSEGYLWHGPALPLLLAPMVAVGLPLWAMRLLTGPLLLFVAVVLFERLLSLRLGRRQALAGAYALGLFVPFGYLLRSIAKEELALILVIAAMHGITRALNGGPRGYVLLAGLALAALVYDRLEYGWVWIVLLVVAAAWAVLRRRQAAPRRFVEICAVALAGCIPWLTYTYCVTGQPLYWGNSGGLSLFWTSAPAPDQHGAWHAVHTVFHTPYLATFRPFFSRIDRLPPLARDLAFQHAAEHNALAHPLRFAVNLAANASRMLFAAPLGVHLPLAVILTYSACIVALLTMAATGIARLHGAPRGMPRETIPFALLLGLGFVIHLLPTADPRMLLPLVPLLVWPAALGWGTAAHADGLSAVSHLPHPQAIELRAMRNMLRSIRRTVLGTQPVTTAAVLAAAVATAVLQSTGFDAWWALPVALVVCACAGALMRRSRP